jgi:hypothetical protein
MWIPIRRCLGRGFRGFTPGQSAGSSAAVGGVLRPPGVGNVHSPNLEGSRFDFGYHIFRQIHRRSRWRWSFWWVLGAQLNLSNFRIFPMGGWTHISPMTWTSFYGRKILGAPRTGNIETSHEWVHWFWHNDGEPIFDPMSLLPPLCTLYSFFFSDAKWMPQNLRSFKTRASEARQIHARIWSNTGVQPFFTEP